MQSPSTQKAEEEASKDSGSKSDGYSYSDYYGAKEPGSDQQASKDSGSKSEGYEYYDYYEDYTEEPASGRKLRSADSIEGVKGMRVGKRRHRRRLLSPDAQKQQQQQDSGAPEDLEFTFKLVRVFWEEERVILPVDSPLCLFCAYSLFHKPLHA